MTQDDWFTAFIITWTALAAATWLVFFRGRNVRLKRRLFPWLVGTGVALFAWFAFRMVDDVPWWVLAALPVILWFNLRDTRFCDACSHPVFLATSGSRGTCRRCGAETTR